MVAGGLESAEMKTPYDILGVPRSADDNAIRAALRMAAKKYHPDVNSSDPDAEKHLKEVIAAYELLMKPGRRAAYDQHLRRSRHKRVRSLLTTALASAGIVSGATLTLAIWLAKPREHPVVAPETSVATIEPGSAASKKVAASKHDVPEEVASRETDWGRPAPPAPSSLAREWEQVAQNGDPMHVWGFALRNPEAPEAELARSWLILLIDASEDAPLLNSLRAADGVVAERARQRLNDMSAAAPPIKEHTPAAIAANDSQPKDVADPPDAAYHMKRGLLRSRNGDIDGAIADYDAAIALEPGNALAHSHRGSSWGGKGDRDRALADFELALRIDPANPAIFRDRGAFWRRTGALDLALVDFDHAIRMGFSDARAYNERGLVWHEKGRYERAIADFTQAIKIDPSLAVAYINRGQALRDKGDLAGSAADLEHATRINATWSLGDGDLARSAN
jgi:curved DNA-binding protein CbpA/Tfp pilus assembly protein PilF